MSRAQRNVGRWIRSQHHAAYQSGKWGRVVALVPARGRACYLIEWPDGKTDVWPVVDPVAEYEFSRPTYAELKRRRGGDAA